MLKERGKRKMKWVFLHKGCPHGCRNWEWLCPKHQKDHAKISGNPAGQPEDCQHDIATAVLWKKNQRRIIKWMLEIVGLVSCKRRLEF